MTKKEKKKKTISVFHGVEHYQQTENKRLRLKMFIAVACCKKYYLKNYTQKQVQSVISLNRDCFLSFDFVYLKLKTNIKMKENCGEK